MKKIFEKRLLFIICFMLLNGIDFVRNTQNGDLWNTAANATGLVMMLIIGCKMPLKKMVTPVNIIWTIICVGLVGYGVSHNYGPILQMYHLAFAVAVMNVWWIVIFAKHILLNRQEYFEGKPGKLAILGLVLTALMTFSRSGRVWPIWFCAMFTMFYLQKYTKKEQEELLDGMLDGNILSFFCLQIFAYGFRPYDEPRYLGAFNNCNITALHYLVIYTMVLLKLHQMHMRGEKRIWKVIFYIGACGMLCFMFLTMGRTSWIAAIVLTLVYGLMVMRGIWKLTIQKLILRGAALGISTMILFPVVFGTVRYLPTILHHPIWFGAEYSIDKVHSFDPADSWKYVEMDEFLEQVFGRIIRTFGLWEENNVNANQQGSVEEEKIFVAGKNMTLVGKVVSAEADQIAISDMNAVEDMNPVLDGNAVEDTELISEANASERAELVSEVNATEDSDIVAETNVVDGTEEAEVDMEAILEYCRQHPETYVFSVGPLEMDRSLNIRLTIVDVYLRNLNLLGHTQNEGHYEIVDQEFAMIWHAQNLWLQVFYSYGIPTGILFLIATVYILILTIKKIKRAPEDPYSIFSFFVCITFFLYGTMEMVWNIGQLIFFMFFFVLYGLGKQEKNSRGLVDETKRKEEVDV